MEESKEEASKEDNEEQTNVSRFQKLVEGYWLLEKEL